MSPAERVQRIQDEIGHVASLYGVKSADSQFMRDLLARNQQSLSAAQEKWLADIEKKVFEE